MDDATGPERACIALSKTTNRALPASFARYIAVSASRIRSSGRARGVAAIAIPMLMVVNTSWPATSAGVVTMRCRRVAIRR